MLIQGPHYIDTLLFLSVLWSSKYLAHFLYLLYVLLLKTFLLIVVVIFTPTCQVGINATAIFFLAFVLFFVCLLT